MSARLTPHQRDTLADLRRRARLLSGNGYGWVYGRDVGAPTACEHLVRKGYAERKIVRGPRGGEHRYYRPTN
jgi:hypothetical protein